MNPLTTALAFVASLSTTLAFASASSHAADCQTTLAAAIATNRFTITGMHCDGCARDLRSELNRVPGVTSSSVSFSNALAVVAYDTHRTSRAKLLKTIVSVDGACPDVEAALRHTGESSP